ncbi:MAG: hypothetical protein CVV22_04245 [Ignavibacteriae bacterium HGW-Ignavibacteriae-1]|nr:MAG: hypothetical protein CVV22_04245 [Ignavibacteriae bacterium HGW-Ignavibacteriae-1]
MTDAPSSDFSKELESLWYDYKGNWDMAHNIVQNLSSQNAAWVHAYLHRKEGDIWNAQYWYSRAGKQFLEMDFEAEFESIAMQLIADNQKK